MSVLRVWTPPNLDMLLLRILSGCGAGPGLRVHLDHRQEWTRNIQTVDDKSQSRLDLLRRLSSWEVCRSVPIAFDRSVVVGAVSFAAVCWDGDITAADCSRLDKLIRRAGSVLGASLESVKELAGRKCMAKLLAIMDDTAHPLHNILAEHGGPFCKTSFATAQLKTSRGPSCLLQWDCMSWWVDLCTGCKSLSYCSWYFYFLLVLTWLFYFAHQTFWRTCAMLWVLKK